MFSFVPAPPISSTYTFIKNKKCENFGVSPLRDEGAIHITDIKKANILNQQFSSVFSREDNTTPPLQGHPNISMPDILINENGVRKLLKDINPFKAAGPDGVQSRFLKEAADEIVPGLTLLFKASIHQSEVPNDWRHANISPLYKPGKSDRSNAENYRPVSLTSVSCKLLEHIIHSNIMRHLDDTGVLSDVQHGFRKKRSCETQLVLTVNDFARSLNEGQQLDTILLDFSKAFDKVNHRKLCLKLNHYGVRGQTLMWIKNFLHNRSQRVVVNGKESSSTDVTSGVPQGTVLGPLLFLVYINDLPGRVKSSIRLFADDSYLYRVINTINDALQLQQDLDELVKWEQQWSMEFHPHKCKVLRITNKRKIVMFDYSMHNIVLEQVEQAKYLGVIIHNKLSWKPHVDYITKKANQTRAFLQRNLRTCDLDVRAQCYKTYVRPIVEYASTCWDPIGHGNKGLREKLEMVQRKSARFVYGDWRRSSSPSKMIDKLKLQSLQTRRAIARIKFLRKFAFN